MICFLFIFFGLIFELIAFGEAYPFPGRRVLSIFFWPLGEFFLPESFVFLDPGRVIAAILVLHHNLQLLQPVENAQERPLMHDADIEPGLIPHDEASQFVLPHSSLLVEVVEDLYVPIQLEWGALALRLLDS
jgi:hypothetical protein